MSKIKQKGSKKIIVRILLIICFIYCFMTPKELTKKYELYAKDVNWENIIINQNKVNTSKKTKKTKTMNKELDLQSASI